MTNLYTWTLDTLSIKQSTGLSQRSNSANNRARPLQASTNIIHTKIPRRVDNLIHLKGRQTGKQALLDPIKEDPTPTYKKPLQKSENNPIHTPKVDENDVSQYTLNNELKPSSTTPVKKNDENDLSEYVKNAYNPLNDVYAFDEELYNKVLNLEIADDGLPSFELEEPFDF